jgi:hypothetical protein
MKVDNEFYILKIIEPTLVSKQWKSSLPIYNTKSSDIVVSSFLQDLISSMLSQSGDNYISSLSLCDFLDLNTENIDNVNDSIQDDKRTNDPKDCNDNESKDNSDDIFFWSVDSSKLAIKNTNKENSLCSVCGKIFALPKHVIKHERVVHNIGGKCAEFQCELCGKFLRGKFSYRLHMKRHGGDYTSVCEQCGKGFIYRKEYEEHIQVVHQGQRFQCPVDGCKESFARQYYMQKHMKKRHSSKELMGEKTEKIIEVNGIKVKVMV